MSDIPAIDPEAYFARLAALDMAAAERAHAKFMVAEETKDVAEHGRNYQRMARSLRQTLTLYARFRKDGIAPTRAPAHATPAWRMPDHLAAQLPPDDDEQQEAIEALDDAVQARIRAEYDPSEAEALETEIDEAFDDLLDEDDFLARPLVEQVDAVMARLRPANRAAARPAPAIEPEPGPEPEPAPVAAIAAPPAEPPAPEPPPPEPPPRPYVPPWELIPPGGRLPGGGSGW